MNVNIGKHRISTLIVASLVSVALTIQTATYATANEPPKDNSIETTKLMEIMQPKAGSNRACAGPIK